MKKGLKIGALVLTGNLALLTLTGCMSSSNQIIDEEAAQKIKVGPRYGSKVDYQIESAKQEEYIEVIYDVEQYAVTQQSAYSFERDKENFIYVPDGYKIYNISYSSNTIKNGEKEYGFIFVMFVNIKPVKVKGYYNKETNTYQFTDFGTVVEKALQKTLTD